MVWKPSSRRTQLARREVEVPCRRLVVEEGERLGCAQGAPLPEGLARRSPGARHQVIEHLGEALVERLDAVLPHGTGL